MKPKTVHLVVQPPTAYSYWTEIIIDGICQEASRREAQVLFHDTPEALFQTAPHPAEVLLVGHSKAWFDASATCLSEKGISSTLVSSYIAVDERYNAVFFSLPTAVRGALAYLKHTGHPRVAFLGINPDSPADCAKVEAFDAAVAELELPGCLNIPGGKRSIQGCVETLLSQLEQFDSALCANDPVAFCLMERMRQEGLRVPEDLFLIGMGNSRFGSNYHTPVTSIAFDYHDLGRQAVHLYMMTCGDTSGIRWRMSLPCKLLVRKTTAYIQEGARRSRVRIGPSESSASAYYTDPDVHFFNRVEGVLQHCDEWDYHILQALIAGATYEQISQTVHFSERSIKYRIKKLISLAHAETRTELCQLLQPIWRSDDRQ